jgi:hypothetical protein
MNTQTQKEKKGGVWSDLFKASKNYPNVFSVLIINQSNRSWVLSWGVRGFIAGISAAGACVFFFFLFFFLLF